MMIIQVASEDVAEWYIKHNNSNADFIQSFYLTDLKWQLYDGVLLHYYRVVNTKKFFLASIKYGLPFKVLCSTKKLK